MQEITGQKADENLRFIQGRQRATQEDLELAEDVLSKFFDANRDPSTSRLSTAVGRLERQVFLKSQLFQMIQTELFQAELEVERQKPVITVIEAPIMPLKPTEPKRKVIVLMSLIFGLITGGSIAGSIDAWKKFTISPEIAEHFPRNQSGATPPGFIKNFGRRIVSYFA